MNSVEHLPKHRLGRSVSDSLQGIAERTQSQDFEWAVMAIEIQREVGGNLAEVLQTVANTMLQRNRLRGEIKALTAEGRSFGHRARTIASFPDVRIPVGHQQGLPATASRGDPRSGGSRCWSVVDCRRNILVEKDCGY